MKRLENLSLVMKNTPNFKGNAIMHERHYLSDKSAWIFASVLDSLVKLRHLAINFSMSNITEDGFKWICSALGRKTSLQSLAMEMAGIELVSDGASCLAQALSVLALTELNIILPITKLNDTEVVDILSSCGNLTKLSLLQIDFRGNHLTNDVLKHFDALVKNLKYLHTVIADFSDNDITKTGIEELRLSFKKLKISQKILEFNEYFFY